MNKIKIYKVIKEIPKINTKIIKIKSNRCIKIRIKITITK